MKTSQPKWNKIINMDFASLYPSKFGIDENLIRQMKKEKLNRERKEKLEKLNNIK